MAIPVDTSIDCKNQNQVSSKICNVKGCNREVAVKKSGLCRKHYDQQRHRGKTTTLLISDPNKLITEGDVCVIFLRNSKQETVAKSLIDIEDMQKIKKYKWHYSKGYAACKTGFLHRLIMPNIAMIDHINRNTLDNRKINLRKATFSTNAANSKLSSRTTSGFKGVSFFKNTGTWRAYITVNQKFVSLGYHKTPEEAAHHYDMAAVKYFGEYATTNKELGLI